MTTATAESIAALFDFGGQITGAEPLGQGLINDTWLLHVSGPSARRAVLQRINPRVFPDAHAIMQNLRAIHEHSVTRQQRARTLRLPGMYRTRRGDDYVLDALGAAWRALHYIENTRTLRTLENTDQAGRVGAALGHFHALLSDLPPVQLRVALPGFHIAPGYLARFDAAREQYTRPHTGPLQQLLAFVEQRRGFVTVLEDAKAAGVLTPRTTHGDPKLDNFLFAANGDDVVSLIDLDTVQAGLIHYDIGDCVRSTCNRGAASGDDSTEARFDIATATALLTGYIRTAREFLAVADFDYLYPAIRLIPFELGLRFLTDHLEGDVYFKIQRPGQNLQRAELQFRLTEDIERHEIALRAMIDALR